MSKKKTAPTATDICNTHSPINDDHISETRKLESSIRDLRGKLRIADAKRKQAEHEAAIADNRIEALEAVGGIPNQKKLQRLAKRKKRGKATAIICANDWHAEERVDPDTIGGRNEFNLEIAEKRIERLWQKSLFLLEFARTVADIDELVVWLGGDLVNGYIHEELEEDNFLGPAEAVSWVSHQVESGLSLLLKEAGVSSIRVPTSMGNHGRSTKKRRISTGYKTSWEYLCYLHLEHLFAKEKQIAFLNEKGYFNELMIQEKLVRFHHGDNVNYGGGVGGVTIPLKKKLAKWNHTQRAEFDVLGHFHQRIHETQFVVSGCLVGYNAYALAIGADFDTPTQTMIVVDEQYGQTMVLPIFVEDK